MSSSSDVTEASYYPSWKVQLVIRFEEFDAGVLKARVPGKLTKNLNGMKDDGSTLTVIPDPNNKGRFIFQDKNPQQQKFKWTWFGVPVPDTSSDDLTQYVTGIIPRSFDWKQNGVRAADELRVQIRAEDFPIDPRTVRSIQIAFYLGTVTALEYAQGARGETRGSIAGPGVPNASEPLHVVPDTYLDANGNQRSNLRFIGFVDKHKMTLSGDGMPLIEFECRDMTQLLLNQGAPPRLVIGGKDPIDKAIATYLSNFPQFSGVSVEYQGGDGVAAPALNDVLAKSAMRPQLGPQPGGGGDDDLTVFDYLTDVCGAIGHFVYMDGFRVIIARPATLLRGVATTRSDDPYKSRTLPSGTFPVRALVYGRNLERLEFSRDFAGMENKNIEVRSYSPKLKKLLVARYPTKDSRIASSKPGDGGADNSWNVVRLRGVEDQTTLNQIAEDYYNGRGRTEIEVVMKTKTLASFGGGNLDPDLLDLKATDAVQVLIDRGGEGTTAKTTKDLTAQGANQQHLLALGYSKAFAQTYAKTYSNAGFQSIFRAREISMTGDVDEGVSVEVRAANFVQVRGETRPVDKPPAAATTAKAQAKTGTTTAASTVAASSSASTPKTAAPGQIQIGTRPDGSPIFGKP